MFLLATSKQFSCVCGCGEVRRERTDERDPILRVPVVCLAGVGILLALFLDDLLLLSANKTVAGLKSSS